MASDAERAGQRREWKRALAAAAAIKRSQRYRRAAPQPRAGMLRKDVTVDAAPMARCLHRGCPVRWRPGPDRYCAGHGEETAADWAARLAELSPGERAGDDGHPGG